MTAQTEILHTSSLAQTPAPPEIVSDETIDITNRTVIEADTTSKAFAVEVNNKSEEARNKMDS